MRSSLLQAIDVHSVVYALSFLGDLEDLLAVAATCAEAEHLVRARWAQLRPSAAFFRARFVGALAKLFPPSPVVRTMRALDERVPRAAPCAAPTSAAATATWELPLLAGRRVRLPVGIGQMVQSMRIAGEWGNWAPTIEIFADEQRAVYVAGGTIAQMLFADPATAATIMEGKEESSSSSSSLDLMQFLGHYVQPMMSSLHVVCSVDAVVTVTECACAAAPGGEWPSSLERHEWRLRSFYTSRTLLFGRGPRAAIILSFALPFAFTAEYLTVHYSAAAPRVKRFTLRFDGLCASIPGWACDCATRGGRHYYRIPIQDQINVERVAVIDTVLDRSVTDELEVHLGVLTSNIVRQTMGLMGVAFIAS